MPWVVGIDEAGYGPNLGPLVQSAVALRLPGGDPAGWDSLKGVVRRTRERADGRLLIDDSKKVYTRGGLEALERGVWAIAAADPHTIHEFLWSRGEVPAWGEDLCAETWFDGTDLVPVHIDPGAEWEATEPLRAALDNRWYGDYRVVPAPRFNRGVDEFGSKAVILSRGLIELLTSCTAAIETDGEPLLFLCDKQGGRNYYAPLLQEAFPDGWVVAERESADESRYHVENLPREVTITFRPRADGDSVAVALASMLCKYLREVCMRQFNRFWAAHVPGIKPTAGYPGDAKRFYDQIQPAMAKLGLTADQVWRKK
jgi:ribonuclease HII